MSLRDFARAQPGFLTQNLRQPFGLIWQSISVQELRALGACVIRILI
jgi:hypothetical protein